MRSSRLAICRHEHGALSNAACHELRRVLRSSSILTVLGDGGEPGSLLVQEWIPCETRVVLVGDPARGNLSARVEPARRLWPALRRSRTDNARELCFRSALRGKTEGQREHPVPRSHACSKSVLNLRFDVNAPDARVTPPVETARYFGSILRQQQPVGGMSGQVNKTLVQQFRMPGYPFVLVSTDLLQEGEDLHTFCSSVLHYGTSWTPSSMEQRIGRIDRVRSQSDRRLSGTAVLPEGADRLQVYYPHLEDTVEVLQVQRVLRRMDTFLRLMHEGLSVPKGDHQRVDVSREMIDASLNSIGATTSSGRLPQWEPPSASS